ncbi:Transferase [Melia azedarach]|uniref:Transferase n=1 Tax=Melia azedarach TaxID=155640 RepID=A0ACC1YDS3_MELAZ|nr:Transferase [Melia azedarach]
MSELLQKNDSNLFKQLVPLNGNMQEIPTTYHVNLILQVNYFGSGGIAISICFNHIIFDGTTLAYFVKSWAEVAGGANDIKNVVVDYSSIRPPYDAFASLGSLYEQNRGHYNPTEMVANADGETHESTAKQMVVVSPINLGDKVNPPLPPQSIGNLVTIGIAKLPIDKGIDYDDLAIEVHKSVRNVVDQYKRNMHVGGLVKGLENSMVFHISDVSRLPFYEADFGWGKPVLLSFIPGNYKAACLTPTNDGAGVQAFITLSKEEMAKFEQDPEFLSYTQPFLSKRARL